MNTKITYILVGKCCVPHGQEFMQDSFKPSLSGGINKNFDRSFFLSFYFRYCSRDIDLLYFGQQ